MAARTREGQIPVSIETAIVLGIFQRCVCSHSEHGLGRRDWPRARTHGQSAAQQRQQRRSLPDAVHVCGF